MDPMQTNQIIKLDAQSANVHGHRFKNRQRVSSPNDLIAGQHRAHIGQFKDGAIVDDLL